MIRLIPNTGIQYAEISDIRRDAFVRHDFQMRVGERFNHVMPMGRPSAANEEEFDDVDYAARSAGLRARSADLRVLDRLLTVEPRGAWLPVPFEGGALWVAAHLRKEVGTGGGMVIRCTLAIDTTLDSDGNPDGLSVDQLGERAPSPTARRFWRCKAVESWLRGMAVLVSEDEANPTEIDRALRELQVAVAGFADLLAKDPQRASRIYMERRPSVAEDVVVDMVLDLGNSRTCALLEERGVPGGRRQRLELRYPDAPGVRDQSPFSTQSAFFEHEIVPLSVGGTVSFRFLSILKMGTGARDALKLRNLDPRPLGLSTPKRYLWEHYGRVDWKWRFANRVDDRGVSPLIKGTLVDHMDPQRIFGAMPALPELTEPDHPRAACMVWVLVELLEQAFQQVNSSEWRRTSQNAPFCDRRRAIRNLVLTYPAGLHSVELENFHGAARAAARLWSGFRTNPDGFCTDSGAPTEDREHGIQPPCVQMICDEGMAIQLCWLYGESVHRFGCDAGLLIDAVGRKRPRTDPDSDPGAPPRDVPTLRLGSIDIGGGTIDLAIADYSIRDGLPAAVAFECDRLFHDSISRAGDEVVRGILEDHVFPTLTEQVGCSVHSWNRVFGIAVPPSDDVQQLRRELVRDVWIPLAMRCLEELERSGNESISIRLGDACSATALLERLRLALALEPSGKRARLEDVVIAIGRREMRRIVRNSIGRTIDQCADIVDQFGCDLLIVGGRPSSNREIREQIYASMAVPPGQVVFLSELSVEDWYPFAERSGKIHDAKTCGVVGGSVAFLARYAIEAFTVEFAAKDEPPPILGYLRQATPGAYPEFPDEQVIDFAGGNTRIPFKPLQPLVLASRHVDDPAAEARPIYHVRLKRAIRDDLLRNPGQQKGLEVKLRLPPLDRPDGSLAAPPVDIPRLRDKIVLEAGAQRGDVVRRSMSGVEMAVSANDALEIRSCTLIDPDGYWIDTGVFRPMEATPT